MAVRCIAAHQLHIYLLNCPLSSPAKQAVVVVEPFSFKIQTMANVFCMGYVVMIVAQPPQVVVRMVSLLTRICMMVLRTRIMSIIHQLHNV